MDQRGPGHAGQGRSKEQAGSRGSEIPGFSVTAEPTGAGDQGQEEEGDLGNLGRWMTQTQFYQNLSPPPPQAHSQVPLRLLPGNVTPRAECAHHNTWPGRSLRHCSAAPASFLLRRGNASPPIPKQGPLTPRPLSDREAEGTGLLSLPPSLCPVPSPICP